jgi:hypothetical protein
LSGKAFAIVLVAELSPETPAEYIPSCFFVTSFVKRPARPSKAMISGTKGEVHMKKALSIIKAEIFFCFIAFLFAFLFKKVSGKKAVFSFDFLLDSRLPF